MRSKLDRQAVRATAASDGPGDPGPTTPPPQSPVPAPRDNARQSDPAGIPSQRHDTSNQRQAAARYRALVEQLPVIVYIVMPSDPLTMTYISPQVETILGFTPAEILARQPAFLAERIHPDDQTVMASAIARTQATGTPFSAEYRLRSRDGRWVWLRDEATAICDDAGRLLFVQGIIVDITPQRDAEIARQAAEARYRVLFEQSLDAVLLLTPTGRILDANPAACRMFDCSADDLLRQEVADIIDPADPRVPDARAHFVRESSFRGELSLRRRGGDAFPADVASQIFTARDGSAWVSLTIRDLASRRQAESALRYSEERFRSAFEFAPIGISIITPDGHYVQVNRALCELVGYSEPELLRLSFQEVTHPDDLAENLRLARRLWAGEIETYQMEKRYLHKDGHVIWALLTASAIRAGTGPQFGLAHIVDITERRNLEADRALVLERETEYARQLRMLAELRADLTTMIAHELRAPVSALRMMTYVLEAGELTTEQAAAMFSDLKGEIAHLDRLIDDVAAVKGAERDDLSVQIKPVPLAQLLDNAAAYGLTRLGPAFAARVTYPGVQVLCDAERISQVLRNLLDNAIKHTPSGTTVELRARLTGGSVRIEVADRGPGLSTGDAALIFEKFGRGSRAVLHQTPGTGLGLYLSRRIVQAHASDLEVMSGPGPGTVFGFDLVVAP